MVGATGDEDKLPLQQLLYKIVTARLLPSLETDKVRHLLFLACLIISILYSKYLFRLALKEIGLFETYALPANFLYRFKAVAS